MSAALEWRGPVVLRPGVEGDRHLVIQSWMRSHRRRAFGGQLDRTSYENGQRWLVTSLLERCALLVACFDEDPDFVLGWAVTSHGAVHYCWVRHAFRRRGTARLLLGPYLGGPAVYTHPISRGADWMGGNPIPEAWVFDPYHAFRIAGHPRGGRA